MVTIAPPYSFQVVGRLWRRGGNSLLGLFQSGYSEIEALRHNGHKDAHGTHPHAIFLVNPSKVAPFTASRAGGGSFRERRFVLVQGLMRNRENQLWNCFAEPFKATEAR